ncbi:MAG: sensor histidine kinase [Clostridia bacterium]|nr:sensor histidine kinase [Clostridia bacterium]
MNRLLCSLPAKIAAIILSYIMVLVIVASSAAVLVMGYLDFYTRSSYLVEKEILTEMAVRECYKLSGQFQRAADVQAFREDVGNMAWEVNYAYTVIDETGEVLYTNYDDTTVLTSSTIIENGYEFIVQVYDEMPCKDQFATVRSLIKTGHDLRYAFIFFAVLGLLAFIVLICFLCCAAGRKFAYSSIQLNFLDRIPLDICLAVAAVIVGVFLIIFDTVQYFEGLEIYIFLFISCTVLYFVALALLLTSATRIKTYTFWKNTLVFKVGSFLLKCFKACAKFLFFHIKRLPFALKTLGLLAIIIFWQGVFLMFNLYQEEWLIIGFVLSSGMISLLVIYVAITLQRIKKGGEKIASGNLESKIDTTFMVLDFKDFANKLNSIGEGMQVAVDEKVKSERFKTELITNVSHDIKTPLTSIINYVDLLKKEEIGNETAKEYIEVIDRHSERLKKLVEDLVEASKASTGSLAVDLQECNVSVLLSQALGEFDERLKGAKITPILKILSDNVIIKADARHLWRVFDNLLSNICKYSLPDTRAYIEAYIQNGKAFVTFKNISRCELSVDSAELTERFVRGDSSRNTEGSGLDLSIAKSLTELQNGQMDITVDGDLFKVMLQFEV